MRLKPQVRKIRAALVAGTRMVALVVATVLVVAAAAWAAWDRAIPFVAGHEYFRLRSIRVACDNPEVEPLSLAELAGLYDDSSLWHIDPSVVERRLREQSWVRVAHVSRRFPWQVSVDVERRHPVAATVCEGRVFLVDQDGVLFQEVEPERTPDLAYVTGWDDAQAQTEKTWRLKGLLAVLAEADRRSYQVSELHMDSDGTVWMYPSDLRAAVRLGSAARAAAALDRLGLALAQLAPVIDQVRSIDADYGDRVVVRGTDDKFPALVAARLDRPPAGAPATAAFEDLPTSVQESERTRG